MLGNGIFGFFAPRTVQFGDVYVPPSNMLLSKVRSLQNRGRRLAEASELNDILNTQCSAAYGIVAAGLNSATGTPLVAAINEVSGVVGAAASGGVVLPLANFLGQMMFVINANVSSIVYVFSAALNSIIVSGPTLAINTYAGLNPGDRCFFLCTRPGFWTQVSPPVPVATPPPPPTE